MDWETNGFWRFGIFTMQKQVPQCGWRAINLIGILLDEISISLIRCRIMCCHNANRQLCLVNCAWFNSKTQCTHYYASWILISFKKTIIIFESQDLWSRFLWVVSHYFCHLNFLKASFKAYIRPLWIRTTFETVSFDWRTKKQHTKATLITVHVAILVSHISNICDVAYNIASLGRWLKSTTNVDKTISKRMWLRSLKTVFP